MFRNFRTEHAGMMVKWFSRVKTVELHRVIDNRDLGSLETVIIHVCTNDENNEKSSCCNGRSKCVGDYDGGNTRNADFS
jgi:hypothetical protein